MLKRFFASRDKTHITVPGTAQAISVEQLQKELETAHGDWARFLLRLAETRVRSEEVQLVIDIHEDEPINGLREGRHE